MRKIQKPLYTSIQRKTKISAKKCGDVVADNLLKNFKQGDRIVGLTNGKFSLISLIHSVLKKIGKSEVIIATWSAGFYDSTVIKELIDSGLITDVKIILDRSFKNLQKQYSSLLTEWFDEKNIRTTSNHAKYVLIKNKDFNITILTSMNLNENMRCENFDISTDIEIYNLFNDFVKDLFATQPAGLILDRKIADRAIIDLFNQKDENEIPEYF